jgi:S-DNA-T family DNA segregation ATPase FtsK/SpoIIIE
VPNPPVFQRAPRIWPEIPKGEVEIPTPATVPAPASSSLTTTLLPRMGAVGGLGAGVFTFFAGNGTVAVSLLAFSLVSTVTAIVTYFSQKKNYQRTTAERQMRYRALLETRKGEFAAMRDKQHAALVDTDPDLSQCVERVQRLDRKLWQRSPQDADFLSVRVGLGVQPFVITIKAPKQDALVEIDPLITEAYKLAEDFSRVPDVPIRLPLYQSGSAGVVGTRKDVLNTTRAIITQIAAHHSPDEVKICALFPSFESEEWDWMRWLPHAWTDDRNHRLLASEKDSALRLSQSLYDLLSRRRAQVAANRDSRAPAPLPYFVFVLADPRLAEFKPFLRLLVNEGQALGAFAIFTADSIDALPKDIRAIVDLGAGGEGKAQLIQTAPVPSQIEFTPDVVPIDLADRLARSEAPIKLKGLGGSADIPNMVPLLDLLGASSVEDLGVLSRWKSSEAFQSMAVPVGRRGGGEPLLLDLHERGSGPHGLVAGTTRAGKSELLQSFISSLAVNFHPYQVSFVLVDYKGGGMADAFLELPHLAGSITNLQGNLASRALLALRSELKNRQAMLAKARENHIDKYQRRYAQGELKEPLPRIIIIVDEFAELATEQPDFMKQLVSTVRVGGSLGVHLILATQKPAGVVSEEIWANTRFRICLRVARPEDSREVLRRPDAASISQPGRAYFQVGLDEVFELFQSAYGGAPYVPESGQAAAPDEIMEIALDGSRNVLRLSPKPVAIQAPSGNQLQAIVAHLRDVADKAAIPTLPGPWLPPLPEAVTLEQVRPAEGWDGAGWRDKSTWLEPAVGLVDDPAHQLQGPLTLPLAREGHLIIYGAPGSGKTTMLQTLVTSLALDHSPQDVHLYLLDFGGRTLSVFGGLPHVGAVILPDEGERLNRLMRYLLRELESRQSLFSQAGVTTLSAYRTSTRERTPAIIVVLDNYEGFSNIYTAAEDTMAQLAREGGNLGIHLIMAANSPSIKSKVSGNITLAVALQMADKTDYATVLGRLGGLEPAPVTGRGLIKGTPPLEFQTALPTEAASEAERSVALRDLVRRMDEAWMGPRARPVGQRPTVVPLSDLITPSEGWPILAGDNALSVPLFLDTEDLEPLPLDLGEGPHFIVTGPFQSGKTTLLQTWALALAETLSSQSLSLYLVDFRRAGLNYLQPLPQVKSYIEDDQMLNAALDAIAKELQERREALDQARRAATGQFDDKQFISGYPALVVVIDDYDAVRDLAQSGTKTKLEQMIRRERGLGFHVMLAGGSSDLSSAFEGWVKALKELQTGIVLGSGDQNDVGVVNIRLTFNEGNKLLPPGEGFYGRRGRYRKIKAATANAGNPQLREWVARIAARM